MDDKDTKQEEELAYWEAKRKQLSFNCQSFGTADPKTVWSYACKIDDD